VIGAPRLAHGQDSRLPQAEISRGINTGKGLAEEARRADLKTYNDKTYRGTAGALIAEGDSWFDYPRADVLKMLQRKFDYQVFSAAHKGDALEDMAYNIDQLTEVAGVFKSLHDRKIMPKAILISGGGNDIAGPELSVMLNHIRSGLQNPDAIVVREVITHRLQLALITWIGAVDQLSTDNFGKKVPVLIHGYDYPVPDGRGFLGGFWFMPGPWLKPSFDLKGYGSTPADLDPRIKVMKSLIDEFNAMLISITKIEGFEHVHYVKIVGQLSNDPKTYENDWGNELHPTPLGFEKVATQFQEILSKL